MTLKLRFTICAALGAMLYAPVPARAQNDTTSDIVAAVRRAAQSKQIVFDKERVRAARGAALSAGVKLQEYLQRGGPETVAGWNDYIKWSRMQDLLRADSPNSEALGDLLQIYGHNESGIEKEPFLNFRDSVRRYIKTFELSTELDTTTAVSQELGEMVEVLERYPGKYDAEDHYRIGRMLGWFDLAGQSSHPAVTTIRKSYDYPNGFVRIGGSFINKMMSQKVSQQTEINESSMGAQTRGRATTTGIAKVDLLPHSRRGTMDVHLLGTMRAPNAVSTRRQIKVFTSIQAELDARKRVYIDETGLYCEPTRANVDASISVNSASAPRRLIERLAVRRAERMLPEAEAETARSTEQRLSTQVDKGAAEPFDEANDIYQNQVLLPLRRFGGFPDLFLFNSSDGHLFLTLQIARANQIGAPVSPPPLDPKHDLGFTVHQSLVANFSEALLGGKTFEDVRWLTFLNVLTGDEPRPLWVHDRTDRWSLTFADERPVSAIFHDGRLAITVRTKRVTRADRHMRRPMEIAATFRGETSDEGPVLVREGDLDVRYADGEADTDEQTEFLRFLRRKFNAIMQPQLNFDGLVPPAGGSFGKLRNLALREFDTADAWLIIGYQLREQSVEAPGPQSVADTDIE